MATEFLPYSPQGGLALDYPPDSIENSEVADSVNFVFARSLSLTRFGASISSLYQTGAMMWARSIKAAAANTDLYFFTAHPTTGTRKLFNTALGEITGAGGLLEPYSAAVVNGSILFGMGQIVQYPPTAPATYTVIAQGYHYLAGHNARALGAYDGSTFATFTRVGWSVVGDVTDWVGVGSGHTDLSDAATVITGLGVLNEVVIICREDGFHFGYPTGAVAMPYRFENRSKNGIGVPVTNRQTLTFFDDMMFFVGSSDVYLFSKDGLRGIGGKNKKEILRILTARTFEGFVTEKFSGEIGVFYHLTPTWPSLTSNLRNWAATTRQPHLVYSLLENKWMKFSYPGNYGGGFTNLAGNFCIGTGSETEHYLVGEPAALEEEAWLKSKTFLVGEADKDCRLRRVLLRYQNQGAQECLVRASATLNETPWEVEERVALGNDPADGKLRRKWVNLELSGNDFQYKVTVPVGNQLAMNLVGGMYEPASDYQGT